MAADPTRPDTWKTLGKLLVSLLAVGVLAAGLLLPYVGGLGVVAGRSAGKFLGTTCNLQESQPPQKTTVYARDGKTVIATLFSQDRVPVPLSQVPQYLRDALIATEDRRFYQHHGVDLRGLIRSAVSTSGGDTQGGSTLTMQYVKQVRYYQAGDDKAKQQAAIDQNLQRKMEDAKCALYIEGTLHKSKDTILDDYLNIAFFGEHSYGIQTAAETYFDKPASKLSLAESALLVGMLRAPSAYDPFQNRVSAKARRDQVLQNLVDVGKLGQAAADRVKATPIALATKSPPQVKQGCANSGGAVANTAFFCEYMRQWLKSVDKISPTQLDTGGYKIITTLDPDLQNSVQRRIAKAVPSSSPMTAVLPAVDPRTGNVLAMAASKTYGTGKGQTEQPIFTSYTAMGASTFKLFPLLAALSTGVPDDWQLTTVGNTGKYKPKNCATTSSVGNGDANVVYNQTESLATATAKSSNTYFVGLASDLLNCQLQPIVDVMTKLGMNGLQRHDPIDNPNLTYAQNIVDGQRAQQLVLGSVPTTPLELAGAYAAVADGGKYFAPAPVLSITDSSGNALPLKRTPAVQAVAPQVAARAATILTGDTRQDGTSSSIFANWYGENGSTVAGKTGTNQADKPTTDNSSIWFVGMTPHLVATSALIDFDNPSKPSAGLPHEGTGKAYGDYAAKVWLDSLGPSLKTDAWQWPDPNTVGDADVPDVRGMSLSDAKRTLADSGFKLAQLGAADNVCPSSQRIESVGYYGPQRANPGDTITVCLSSGVPQYVFVPPPPAPVHHRAGGTQNHGGGNGGGGGGGGSGHGGGSGGGGAGHGGGGHGGGSSGAPGHGGGGGGASPGPGGRSSGH